jgi:glucose-6-phosphate isomerase
MVSLDIKNLHKVDSAHGLTEGGVEEELSLIQNFLDRIEERNQGFHQIIDDENFLNKIDSFAANAAGKYDFIVVLGIGGSALGTICIQQSLSHLFTKKPGFPQLIVLDNIDPILIQEAAETINPQRTLFLVVTKSGTTAETLSQFFFFKDHLLKNGVSEAEINSRFVLITDPQNGFLRKLSLEENFITFDIPENVGGRFSVLTAVGLLPAALIGIDIRKIIEGAVEMRELFYKKNKENLPFLLASVQYLLYKKGKTINVLMPYAQKLIKFADWFRQLIAESTGKKHDNAGEEIFSGITPVNALGVTDQHSQSQLYNEGPNDKLIIFISAQKLAPETKVPMIYPQYKEVHYLNNISFNQLINTEMQGTIDALTQNNRPNIEIKIDQLNEKTLGELFFLFEGATAFLGEFMNINAFDQPGVELSKMITKQLLNQHGNSISTATGA